MIYLLYVGLKKPAAPLKGSRLLPCSAAWVKWFWVKKEHLQLADVSLGEMDTRFWVQL